MTGGRRPRGEATGAAIRAAPRMAPASFWSFWLPAAALILVSGAGIAQLALYFHLVPWDYLRDDSLYELRDWVRGEPFPERLRHNASPSPIQSLLLALDVYLGPYPYWSRGFAVAGVAAGLATFGTVLARLVSREHALLVLAVFVGFWFSASNEQQKFTYVWRTVEAACHLLCLGIGAAVIGRWSRREALSGATLVLLGLLFLFSHVHKAFGYFLGLTLLGAAVLPARRERLVYLGVGLGYLFHGALLMPFLGGLDSGSTRVALPSPSEALDYGLAFAALVTAPIRDALAHLAPDPAVLAASTAAGLAVVWAAGTGAWRSLSKRDWTCVLAVFVTGVNLGLAGMTVLGRFPAYGGDVARASRYWSDALLVLLGALVLLAARAPRRVFWPVAALCLALGASETLRGFGRIPGLARSIAIGESMQFAHVLHPGAGWTVPQFSARHARAFRAVRPVVVAHGVGALGMEAFEERDELPAPGPARLATCEGRLAFWRAPEVGALAVRFAFDPGRHLGVRFGAVWDAGELVGFGRALEAEGEGFLAVFAPSDVAPGSLVLYGAAASGDPLPLCERPLLGEPTEAEPGREPPAP